MKKHISKNYVMTVDTSSVKDRETLKDVRKIVRDYNLKHKTNYVVGVCGTKPKNKELIESPRTGEIKYRNFRYDKNQGNVVGGLNNANEIYVYVYEKKLK